MHCKCLPEHFMPILLYIGHLVERYIQLSAYFVRVLVVLFGGTHPLLIQRVPVFHENSCNMVA